MTEKLITEKEAMKHYERLSDAKKVKILTKALREDNGGSFEYQVLSATDKFAYTDVWCDDENGFYWKKI